MNSPHQFETPCCRFLEKGDRAGREEQNDRKGSPGGKESWAPKIEDSREPLCTRPPRLLTGWAPLLSSLSSQQSVFIRSQRQSQPWGHVKRPPWLGGFQIYLVNWLFRPDRGSLVGREAGEKSAVPLLSIRPRWWGEQGEGGLQEAGTLQPWGQVKGGDLSS